MKKLTVLALITLIGIGCGNPKNTVIPSDISQMATIQPSINKLSEEDKKLFFGYVMRNTMKNDFAGFLGGKTAAPAAMPEGITIGQAIEDQKAEEAKQKVREASLLSILSAATEAAKQFGPLQDGFEKQEKALRTSSAGSKKHANAQSQINNGVAQALELYPELINYLHKENGQYVNVTESMERYRVARIKSLDAAIEESKRKMQEAQQISVEAMQAYRRIREETEVSGLHD